MNEFVASLDFSGFILAPKTFLSGLKRIDPQLAIWPRANFVLDSPLKELSYLSSAEVRKVTPSDAAALEKIGQSWLWKYWQNIDDFCRTGTAYVAIARGEAASVASVFTESDRYVDLAVATHPAFRGKGLAIATTRALCEEILAIGKIPVWNTSPENIASCVIGRKLGFREISAEPLYVIQRDIPRVA